MSSKIVVPNVGGTDIRETNNLKLGHDDVLSDVSLEVLGRLDRLPTLFEVLNKRTDLPVDLWSFYVFMRDEQHAVDYLDFWIDVVSHLALCKQYVKGLRESVFVTEKRVKLSQFEQPNVHESYPSDIRPKTHLMSLLVLLEALINEGVLDDHNLKRLLLFLRGDEPINDQRFSELLEKLQKADDLDVSPAHPSGATNLNHNTLKDLIPELQKAYYNRYLQSSASNKNLTQYPSFANAPPLPEGLKLSAADMEVLAAEGPRVAREDLRLSSRRILVTYFIDNSEKKLQLPEKIIRQIREAIELQGRDDPEVFDEARDYVFQAMEREAFPNFLKSAALNNITNKLFNIRLVAGFFFYFVAFWVGYTLIFLGYKPQHDRATVTVPFTLGTYCLITALFKLDPILCFAGYAESNALTNKHHYVKLSEPYVKKLLTQRSFWVVAVICVIAAAFSVLFALVPGHRL